MDWQLKKKKNSTGCVKILISCLLFFKREEVHELNLENSWLTTLLCKLRALRRWKQVVDQEKLHRQLLQSKQVSGRMKQCTAISFTSCRKETRAYRVKVNSGTLCHTLVI